MIASLRVQHFRSFDDLSLEFEQGVNIIIGPNASGKTNLLESILVVARGSSYRGSEEDLIQRGAKWARIDATTDANMGRSVILKKQSEGTVKKSYTINNNEYQRLQSQHKLPTVIFEPNQLLYIASSPELRRSLVDNLNEQLDSSFGVTKRAYNRALMQRNTLLKTNKPQDKLFAWDVRLSELGGSVVASRLHLLDQLNSSVGGTYSDLAGIKHDVKLGYASKIPVNDYSGAMLKILQRDAQKDIERGFTGAGPHRDDIEITINKRSIQTHASRGEIRTVLLAIKVQEALLLEEKFSQKSLMLLDDVFGELDGKRRQALTRFLQTHQAFITTTDADVVGRTYTKNSSLINLSNDSKA